MSSTAEGDAIGGNSGSRVEKSITSNSKAGSKPGVLGSNAGGEM